ncbi:hypothetical protein [Sneathiella sp.]|uniref:hypothetical protein n=1 Tax=Sneathiella sp. TaxID=1964365 RepID=UPI0039E3FE8B
MSFGLAGLAVPQGILGPEGREDGQHRRSSSQLPLSADRSASKWNSDPLPDPKTQTATVARNAQPQTNRIPQGCTS